jgi:hypothetical protein
MGRRIALVVLLVVALVVPASPALGVNEYLCEGVLPAPFTDVDPASPFWSFINCLVAFGITSGTTPTTYSPTASVERWQMAIFLQNVWGALFLPFLSGGSQGFTDIGGLSVDAQLAINQTAQIGVTTGVAAGLYDPFSGVPRWQMAIFLARFIAAAGVGVPSPSPHGFTDVGALSVDAQNAIAVVKSLGITTGTSATTFSPNDIVTREQMAAFLIRTLQVAWFIAASDFVETCVPDSEGVDICTGSGDYFANVPIRFLHLFWVELPADTSPLDNAATRIDFFIDGALQTGIKRDVILPAARFQYWEANSAALTGSHVLEARYYLEGTLIAVETVTVVFS